MSWRWQIIFPKLSKTVGTIYMYLSFDDLIDFHGWLSVRHQVWLNQSFRWHKISTPVYDLIVFHGWLSIRCQDWLDQSFRWHRLLLLSTGRPCWWMALASRLLMIHKLYSPTASHPSPLSIPLVTALSLLLDQVPFLCRFYTPRTRPCVDWRKGYLVRHYHCFFQLAEFCLCGLLVLNAH